MNNVWKKQFYNTSSGLSTGEGGPTSWWSCARFLVFRRWYWDWAMGRGAHWPLTVTNEPATDLTIYTKNRVYSGSRSLLQINNIYIIITLTLSWWRVTTEYLVSINYAIHCGPLRVICAITQTRGLCNNTGPRVMWSLAITSVLEHQRFATMVPLVWSVLQHCNSRLNMVTADPLSSNTAIADLTWSLRLYTSSSPANKQVTAPLYFIRTKGFLVLCNS